jgi:rhodanese-related sulfurtransferase
MATLAQLMETAERTVPRLDPVDAAAAIEDGAILVDIRTVATRERDGIVPGALHINRTVLEWRLDPVGHWRTPYAERDARVVVMCDHGYSSLLSAATLREIGVDAADVRGGFGAWKEAGLVWAEAADAPLGADELQGMRGPGAA